MQGTPLSEHADAMQRAVAAINKRDERIAAVRQWFIEWEQAMPTDLRQAFAQALPWAVPVEAFEPK